MTFLRLVLLLALSTPVHATLFEFSYDFETNSNGQLKNIQVGGSFEGTLLADSCRSTTGLPMSTSAIRLSTLVGMSYPSPNPQPSP